MAESLITVRIIHFDDEVNTVSNIPASLYNYFVSRCERWMREEETVTRRYIESFVVRPPSGDAVRVEYHLMADVDECRERLKTFNVRTDIAIFDLMRQADKGIEPIGRDLYLQMRNLNVEETRIFILTGFPHLFEESFPEFSIPSDQMFLKPMPSNEVAVRLVQLLPDQMQI